MQRDGHSAIHFDACIRIHIPARVTVLRLAQTGTFCMAPAATTRRLCMWLVLGLFGCTPERAPESESGLTAAPTSADVATPDCPPLRRDANGACCATGSFFDFPTGSCVPVGPPACAGVITDDPGSCSPRWCSDWHDDTGKDCAPEDAGCWLQARECSADEIAAGAGCAAGTWPDPRAKVECVQPGGGAVATRRDAAGGRDDLGLPAIGGLPVGQPPRWCWQGSDEGCFDSVAGCGRTMRPCDDAERASGKGCPAGTGPTWDQPEACAPAGLSWTCPPGFVVTTLAEEAPPGLAACVPDPADCPAGKWPAPGAGKNIYVDVAALQPGDGSVAYPHKSLAKALTAAPTGATIMLAAGTYEQALNLPRSLTIKGVCAHLVHIDGSSQGGAVKAKATGPASYAAVSGVTLKGAGVGVFVAASWKVSLFRVHVTGSTGNGLFVRGTGSRLTLVDSVVANTEEVKIGNVNGQSASVRDGGVLALRRVRLSRGHASGISIKGPGGRVVADGLLVDQARASFYNHNQGAAIVAINARVDLHRVRLAHNTTAGLVVVGKGGVARAVSLRVQDTKQRPGMHNSGVGIRALLGGQVRLFGARVDNNRVSGVSIFNPGSRLLAGGLQIQGTTAAWDDGGAQWLGNGLWLQEGGSAAVAGVDVLGNQGIGVVVFESDAELVASDLRVAKTQSFADGRDGRGIWIANKARADLQRTVVDDNKDYGIWVHDKGSTLRLRSGLVARTNGAKLTYRPTSAIAVTHQASVRLRDVRLSQNAFTGLRVESGADVRGAGLLIDHGALQTIKLTSENDGVTVTFGVNMGLAAFSGASVQLAGVRLSRSIMLAAPAYDPNTRMVLHGALIDHTLEDPFGDQGGIAVSAEPGSEVSLEDSWLVANHSISGHVASAKLRIERSVIEHTDVAIFDDFPDKKLVDVEVADGILALPQAELVMRRNLLWANPRSGLLAQGEMQLTLLANAFIDNGYGVVTQQGAEANVGGNLLHGNELANVASDAGLIVVAPPAVVP